jgi:hypothetical protein
LRGFFKHPYSGVRRPVETPTGYLPRPLVRHPAAMGLGTSGAKLARSIIRAKKNSPSEGMADVDGSLIGGRTYDQSLGQRRAGNLDLRGSLESWVIWTDFLI